MTKEKNEELFQKTSFATGVIEPVKDSEEKFWIRPSDIIAKTKRLRYETFTSSFGSYENEATAYLICRFFAENGDTWYPVNVRTLDNYVKGQDIDLVGETKLFASREDYAVLVKGEIIFTNLFIERCAGFRALDELERHKVKNVFELADAS